MLTKSFFYYLVVWSTLNAFGGGNVTEAGFSELDPLDPENPFFVPFQVPQDTGKNDTDRFKYREEEQFNDGTRDGGESPLILDNPSNVETVYELAPDGKGYYIYKRVGGENIGPPSYISMEDYQRLHAERSRDNYFREKNRESAQAAQAGGGGLIPDINVNSRLFETVFGSPKIDIKPNVSVLLDFSVRNNRMQNPNLTLRQQRNTSFNFDQQIQLNVVGQIGERLKLNTNYDTEATFQFENEFKIGYEGQEDDIIKKIEAGNVSLPINGSLITGGQNLWGVKLESQFGPVFVTTVASQQRGKTSEITVSNGGQQTEFELKASDYDYNRHFFLNHYFRSIYEQSLQQLPAVNSPINITRVEVWITNRNSASNQNNRNAVGFVDLGENRAQNGGRIWNTAFINPTENFPSNGANNLYGLINQSEEARSRNTVRDFLTAQGLEDNVDFELIENMRPLNPQEYSLNPNLGYISLNTRLQPNDVLFVAYEYTLAGQSGVFKVGEFSQDQPANAGNTNLLFLKMLKPSSIRPQFDNQPFPTWDLMMKNVYNIGGYNLQPDGFQLDIVYQATDGSGDINYLPTSDVKNRPLKQIFDVDQLTNNNERGPDNVFDFIPGITVIPDKGAIVFPVLEPFGSHLVDQFENNTEEDSAQYAFTPLYDLTQQDAIQYFPQLDRFLFKGFYTGSAGSEIYLNTVQVTEGSVTVTAGGSRLQEGTDYTVDYQIGKVTIINPGILSSGQDIKVSFESNDLFGIDQKTLVGLRVDYRQFENFTVGATAIHLNERPLINKINIGDEPVSNVIWGVDATIREESRFLTTLVDKLPFHDTKAPSEVQATAEFAQLIPGSPRQIKTAGENGIAYLDDFEGARSVVDLSGILFWKLASRPRTVDRPPGDSLSDNYTRAKLAWYQIDPLFYDQPERFGYDDQSQALNNQYTRRVNPQEVFPNRDIAAGANILTTFDLHYYPAERGPYNYQTAANKLNPDGTFTNPEENWAGLMRRTTGNTDFEAANFEFIEFWMLDPFMEGSPNGPPGQANGGDFYINLGKISEDVLPDSRRSFENGLPTNAEDNAADFNLSITDWGRVSDLQVVTNAFDNNPGARDFQDVGYDGLRDEDEREFFAAVLTEAAAVLDPEAYAALEEDPSGDNYNHFSDFGDGIPILERYRNFNGPDGNSPVNTDGQEFTRSANPNPDVEDINADGTLNTAEQYFEYAISLRPEDMVPGENFIVDRRVEEVELPNNDVVDATWYQFRIPLREGSPVNGISDFKAIDFIRMYMTGFEEEVILRFGKFELVSTQWRVDLAEELPGDPVQVGDEDPEEGVGGNGASIYNEADFEIGTVNIEENGTKLPFNYDIPPDIERQQQINGLQQGLRMNEQSLVMKVRNLKNGHARAAFRRFNFDLRNYAKLKLWAHTEGIEDGDCGVRGNVVECGDVNMVVRLGSDFEQNYYEVEIPLCPPEDYNNANPPDLWQDIEIVLEDLSVVKQRRNDANFSRNEIFTVEESGRTIRVRGTPQINQTKIVWIGVKNPETPGDNDQPVCAEVWVNELRVTDFNNQSSWAANARVNLRLADFMNVQASVSKQTPYFGGVEQRVNERSLEDRFRYDLAANIQAGKLLPEWTRLEIPVYLTYGEQIVTPEFNPLDPDISLDAALRAQPNPQERNQKLRESTDYVRQYSYSFNNVRILPAEGQEQPMPWSASNFAVSYGYNERFARNAQIEYHKTQNYRGSVQYNYRINSQPIRPFQGFGTGRNLISEFNFNPLPKSFAVMVEGDRHFEEKQLRAVSNNNLLIEPVFNQNFTIRRQYNMAWDLTRSLSINYTAAATARVDEPRGRVAGARQDTLLENILSFGEDPDARYPKFNTVNLGRLINFNQNFTATYRLPFNLIKPLNWVNTTLNYNANMQWITASLENQNLGNNIGNGRTFTVNGQFNMGRLYKMFPVVDEMLKPIPKKNVISRNDSTREEGDDPYVGLTRVGKVFARWLFSVQSIDFNYTINQSTNLQGYLPRADNFGVDWNYENPYADGTSNAPGLGYAFGYQPDLTNTQWLREGAEQGWFTRDTTFFTPFQQMDGRQFQARTSLELFKGFRVDVNVTKQTQRTTGALWSFDNDIGDFALSNQSVQGQFTMSFVSFGSAFEGENSQAFTDFDQNTRRTISQRLARANPNYFSTLDDLAATVVSDNPSANEYENGYTGSSQDVLIPAFLSAYGPYSAENIALSPFPRIPLPNWQVNYNGLTGFDALRDLFKTFTIRHGYRSTYTNSYLLNNRSLEEGGFIPDDGFSTVFLRVDTGAVSSTSITGNPGDSISVVNFEPVYTIQTVSINEAFSPLIGVNFTFNNGIGAQVDFKRSRTLTLNVGALQLNENRNTELTINLSWRKERSLAPISIFGREISLQNSFTVRFETTLRNTQIQNRRLDSPAPAEPTGGTFNLTIKPSIDYMVNTQLSVRAYVEHTRNRPALSTSFPSNYTAVGVQVRFTLSSSIN